MASAGFSPVAVAIGPGNPICHIARNVLGTWTNSSLVLNLGSEELAYPSSYIHPGGGGMFPPLHIDSKASQDTYGTVRAGEREMRDREPCGERLGQTLHSGCRVGEGHQTSVFLLRRGGSMG